jgi:hypothetical protein
MEEEQEEIKGKGVLAYFTHNHGNYLKVAALLVPVRVVMPKTNPNNELVLHNLQPYACWTPGGQKYFKRETSRS